MQTPVYKILIYETDVHQINQIAATCRQLGAEPHPADTQEKAVTLIQKSFFELAIVTTELPILSLPRETRRILIAKDKEPCLNTILSYQPEATLLHPLTEAEISSAIISVSGTVPSTESAPCGYIDLLRILKEQLFRFNAVTAAGSVPIQESVESFCLDICSFATKRENIPETENSLYEPLADTSSRGQIFCKYRNTCHLKAITKDWQTQHPGLAEPPSNILMTAIPEKYTQSLADACSFLQKVIEENIQKIRQQASSFCKTHCHEQDPKAAKGVQRKNLCCGFGCVLDNYLELKPQKEFLQTKTAVIYDNMPSDAQALEFLCRQFAITTRITTSVDETEKVLRETHPDLIFINPNLDTVAIPWRTKVVIVDDVSVSIIARILTYKPVSIIPKPFQLPTMSLGLLRAVGIPFNPSSTHAALTNIHMILDTTRAALTSWSMQHRNTISLTDSIHYFCENRCQEATLRTQIPDTELSTYFLLNPFSRRGAIYCRKKTRCKLQDLLTRIEKDPPTELMPPTAQILHALPTDRTVPSLSHLWKEMIRVVANTIQLFNQQRLNYCTTVCDQCIRDLGARKGDIVFSNFEETMRTNTFTYCRNHECPLMGFFEYFRKTVT